MNHTVVSLFSGGGGLDLGFKEEGYNIIWAIDNVKNAADTYRANIGDHIICEDINRVAVADIPNTDIVIGGPPCQSFSLIGKRNTEDERGVLVWKYIEIIKNIKPRAFVFENVTGLLSAKNSKGEKIIDQLLEQFEKIGYKLNWQVINAADYGIPQKRKRVIIVGMRDNKTFIFPMPTHSEDGKNGKKYVSVTEALEDLPTASENITSELEYCGYVSNRYQKVMRGNNKAVTEHFIPQASELDKYIIAHVKPGGNYMNIPSDVKSNRIRRIQKEGGRTTYYGRLDPNKPSYTINTYFNRPNVGCNIHYSQDRLITVREGLRLQSFPDSYRIVSSNKQGKYSIVGNAVPPMLAQIIAAELKKYL